MILDNNEVVARLESPNNLLNRIRMASGDVGVVLPPREKSSSSAVALPPTADELIDDLDDKLSEARVTKGAHLVLDECINALRGRINSISKPEKISQIAANMGKVIASTKEEKKNTSQTVIIFKPMQANEASFEVVHVNEAD